tara:strand:+ start:122 stop:292 length:171 start_codon:yes stop_codon:yes gene_type:complete
VENYSIEEILSAVEDLQKIKKVKSEKIIDEQQNKKSLSEIPLSTLRLIEEAEKSEN